MEERLPMSVVYALRNGEIKMSDVILPDIPLNRIRGLMITPHKELMINEIFENFEKADALAKKVNGKLLSVCDRFLLRSSYSKIKETIRILKEKMGESYPFHEVDTIKGTQKTYWCQEYRKEDITSYIKEPYRHYGLCMETGECILTPDCMYQAVKVIIEH